MRALREWFVSSGRGKHALGYIATLIVGVVVGAVFYPSKRQTEHLKKTYEQQLSQVRQEHAREISMLEEKYKLALEEHKSKLAEYDKRVITLTAEIRSLRSKQQTSRYKIVHPDGTVEEKEFTKMETSESSKMISKIREKFNAKVAEIETKWMQIHRDKVSEIKREFDRKESEYKSTIASLERRVTVEINPRRFGLEVGLTDLRQYYLHATADLAGPIFFGVHGQSSSSGDRLGGVIGVGVGVRF